MDEFERNEINENPTEEVKETPKTEETFERNTNAPSGWTYSANTNQYVSWDGSSDSNNAQWNPGQQQKTEQQPPRREYGTQYGYYGGQQQTNYYSSNGNYQWDFNKYESAEQNSAPKKKSGGKGFKVFAGIIGAIFAVCIVSLSSVGIYRLLTGENRISPLVPETLNPGTQEEQTFPEEIVPPELDLQDIPKENTVSTGGKLSASEIYKMTSPSVVGVVQYQYSRTIEPVGAGSGIIISDDGYIVTNAHVIDDAEAVKVILYNEEEYDDGKFDYGYGGDDGPDDLYDYYYNDDYDGDDYNDY
jgi:serine protease Do